MLIEKQARGDHDERKILAATLLCGSHLMEEVDQSVLMERDWLKDQCEQSRAEVSRYDVAL